MEGNVKNKFINKIGLLILLLGIVLIICGVTYLSFKSIMGKNKESNIENNDKDNKDKGKNKSKIAVGVAENFEGIYVATNDKIYISKINTDELNFVIADSFHGIATIIDEKTARLKNNNERNIDFEFKLVDEGIELTCNSNENSLTDLETGLYKKVSSTYSEADIYEVEFGDPIYLRSVSTGLYVSDSGIEIYLVQTDKNTIRVLSKSNSDELGHSFNKKFEIRNSDNRIVSYSNLDENKVDYELKIKINAIDDKDLSLIVYDENTENKKYESNYKFKKDITVEEVVKKFYSSY